MNKSWSIPLGAWLILMAGLYLSEKRMEVAWIALIPAVTASAFLHFNAKRAQDARSQAILLGLTVEEFDREVPFFKSNDQEPELRMTKATGYCLRHMRTKSLRWSFLQRAERDDAEFPNGWTLVIETGSVPDGLKSVLEDISFEWDEEFLEFECDAVRVCAFWEEWGGRSAANKIHHYLARISEATQ